MFTSDVIRMIRLPTGPSPPKEISIPAVRRKASRGFLGQLAEAGGFFLSKPAWFIARLVANRARPGRRYYGGMGSGYSTRER
jgi:hypothetical protein